jgi:hypothetical protein
MSWKPSRSSGIVFDKLYKSTSNNREKFFNHQYFQNPTFDNLKKLSTIAFNYINSETKLKNCFGGKSKIQENIRLLDDLFIDACNRNLDKINPKLSELLTLTK